jgi:hypothetical protein
MRDEGPSALITVAALPSTGHQEGGGRAELVLGDPREDDQAAKLAATKGTKGGHKSTKGVRSEWH